MTDSSRARRRYLIRSDYAAGQAEASAQLLSGREMPAQPVTDQAAVPAQRWTEEEVFQSGLDAEGRPQGLKAESAGLHQPPLGAGTTATPSQAGLNAETEAVTTSSEAMLHPGPDAAAPEPGLEQDIGGVSQAPSRLLPGQQPLQEAEAMPSAPGLGLDTGPSERPDYGPASPRQQQGRADWATNKQIASNLGRGQLPATLAGLLLSVLLQHWNHLTTSLLHVSLSCGKQPALCCYC